MSDFTIRLMQLEDVHDVISVQRRSYPPCFHEPEHLILNIIKNCVDTCYVATSGTNIIGFMFSHPSHENRSDYEEGFHEMDGKENVMYLHDLCIDPSFQSKGVGKSMFKKLEEASREMALEKIIAIAVGDAASYWKKLGFSEVKPYFYNGEPGQYIEKEL